MADLFIRQACTTEQLPTQFMFQALTPRDETGRWTKGQLRLTGVERINQDTLRRHPINVSNPAANNTIAAGSGTGM
jgi:hypothetical protein